MSIVGLFSLIEMSSDSLENDEYTKIDQDDQVMVREWFEPKDLKNNNSKIIIEWAYFSRFFALPSFSPTTFILID